MNGNGKAFAYDNTYIGEFKNKLYHGKGKKDYLNGDIYIGEFYKNLAHGKGKFFSFLSGAIYDGEFVEGKKQGLGTLTKTSYRYEGLFFKDKK